MFLADARAEDDLYGESGELTGLADVLDPVLSDHGFAARSEVITSEDNGDVYVEAADPTGWQVRVTAYGARSRIDLSGPVSTETCDASALATVADG